MNKRIEELAQQCHHLYSEHHIDLEKFAELIVKECRDMFVVGSVSWNLLNEKLEHFGVE